MSAFPISPLSLECFTRDVSNAFDPSIIAQLAPLAHNPCYQPKVYRAPALSNEVIVANGYASYGLKITPGSIIYGFFVPVDPNSLVPDAFNVQVHDQSLKMKWFDEPVPSIFLGNARFTQQQILWTTNYFGVSPCFLDAPYPVVGTGLFLVELWETSGTARRIELVFGVLEPVGDCS